jgi:hypothetical protein
MVPPRRRLAQRISYLESGSELEDEEQGESFAESDDDSPEPQAQKRRRWSPPAEESQATVRTRRQPRKTYIEDSSTETDSDSDFPSKERMDVDDNTTAVRKRSIRATASKSRKRPAKRATTSPRKVSQRREDDVPTPRRQQPGAQRLAKYCTFFIYIISLTHSAVAEHSMYKGPSQADLWLMGAPCAWTDLPFEILRDILSYASYPLFDDNGEPTCHASWLLKFRNIHPALLEASQAVLYYCPPITSAAKAHNFLSLMSQSANRTTNYNVKVKHLELEVRNTLAYSAGAELGSLDVGALVKQLPQLIGIDIWTVLDNPEIRRTGMDSRAWSYPDSLFEALSDGTQRLRHFHWNSRFMTKLFGSPSDMYQWMNGIHRLPSFQSLTYLKLTSFLGDSGTRLDLHFPVNFSSPSKPLTTAQQNKEAIRLEKKAVQRRQDELLAKALEVLPNLRKLDLHLCSIVDGDWLQLLPRGLTHLGIIECDGLVSEGLEEFLSTHGQHLKVLVLNHNPALDISFLTTLAANCPGLQEFVMDLTYFSRAVTGDGTGGPDYVNLLLPEEKPTWPRTLQTIHMNHLHRWTASAAEVFFTSLIESAEHLPDLRRLLLSTSLNISWRERAKMRDMWEDKFKRVFLRRATPPNPNWWSIRAFNEWKEKEVAKMIITSPKPDGKDITAESVEETATGEDSDMPLNRRKRKAPVEATPTRRLRPRKIASDDDDAPVPALGGSWRDMAMEMVESPLQGMCEEVDVRIDNLRPREEQFHESDFLDSEPSGDEEWNGVDLDDDELYVRHKSRRKYAW